MGDRGRYLYAVCRGLDPAALTGVPALGDGPATVVGVRDLQAVVSTVDLDEFGEDGLRANLEQLDWVERTARGHDAVVHACAAAAPTAPMRLATVCLDDDSVRMRLEEWYDALVEVLDRVAGCEEWSVKVYTRATTEATADQPAAGSGAEYLRRKKAASQARQASEAAAMAAAEHVDETLRSVAVASRHLRAQDPRLSGHEGTMLLNGAYLVESAAAFTFAQRVGELETAHPEVAIACGGPWPPYSFATLESR